VEVTVQTPPGVLRLVQGHRAGNQLLFAFVDLIHHDFHFVKSRLDLVALRGGVVHVVLADLVVLLFFEALVEVDLVELERHLLHGVLVVAR